MAEERWVGMEEVTAHLQVAKESIYRWSQSKGFPAHRLGRIFRFKLSEVDEWAQRQGNKSARRKKAGGNNRVKKTG